MLAVGHNAGNKIAEFSRQFQSDFVRLLRSSHGEKKINANRFYQEYISNKEHIHMNATRWASLGEVVRYLGSIGVVKVEETEEDGLCMSYIDNSPDAVERREYLKRKAGQDVEDEERASRLLQKQIDAAGPAKQETTTADPEKHELKREEGVKLSIGKPLAKAPVKAVKKPNVFGKVTKTPKEKKSTTMATGKSSVLEKLMLQDQRRKGIR